MQMQLAKKRFNQTSVSFRRRHFRITSGWGDCAQQAHSSLAFTQPPGRQQQGWYHCLSLICDPGSLRSPWAPVICSAAHSSSARRSSQGQTQRKQPSVHWRVEPQFYLGRFQSKNKFPISSLILLLDRWTAGWSERPWWMWRRLLGPAVWAFEWRCTHRCIWWWMVGMWRRSTLRR